MVSASQAARLVAAATAAQAAARHDVVVVGGGLIGLSLACALARVGFDVAVVDREDPADATAAGFDGRASAIAFASRRMLDAVGVWPDLTTVAQPILDIRVSDRESLLHLHFDHRELDSQPFGYMVENRHLRTALLAAARRGPNLVLHAPRRVVDLERGPGLARAVLDDGSAIEAPLVVACDGRASSLRAAAGIKARGWSYPQCAIVCTIAHERAHRGIAHERFLPSGPFAVLPLTGDRTSLVWTERADLAATFLALDRAGFDLEMRRRLGDFLGAARTIGPRWSYPLAMHHAERYVDRRLALVGDAAHGVHPIAGQGLNMGLRDVAALTEVLVDTMRLGLDIGATDRLERYQRWRRLDNLTMIAVTDALNRLFVADSAPLTLARDLGLAAVDRLPPLKHFFMRHARGTVGALPRLLTGETP